MKTLKEYIIEQGGTFEQASRDMNISTVSLINMCNGKNLDVRLSRIMNIAHYLNVSTGTVIKLINLMERKAS